MDWKQYEEEIYQHFTAEYPSARVTKDARITGRFSGVERQIDILVEGNVAGFRFRIAIDAKHYSRAIDVTYVEAFIGYCSDIGVSKGVLIAPHGFTTAAANRAHNDESDIELDVLNFKDLSQFQGFGAIPYAGSNGVLLAAPFGWVIDGTRRPGMVATLYQRGYDLEAAGNAKEWMYVNFWAKDETARDLEALLKHQEQYLFTEFPTAKISYLDSPQRNDAKTAIRRFEEKSYPTTEYTGFVEFDAFIFFCVLFSPPEFEKRNLRKLDQILSTALPIGIKNN